MPVGFVRIDPPRTYLPIAARELTLGADLDCDLVDLSPGVAAHHATLRYLNGEWMLTTEGDLRIQIGRREASLMALGHGDVLRLAPHAHAWRFRNRMADAFVPPGAGFPEAWAGHPAFGDPEHGPEALGTPEPIGGRERSRCGRVEGPEGDWVVKRLGPGRDAGAAQRHLEVLAAVGGAPHRALARLVDGGLSPGQGGADRWLATAWVEGRPARELLRAGGTDAARVTRVLHRLAGGLTHLHRRGVIHRDVSPGNVILGDRAAVLIDYGQAVPAGAPLPPSAGVVGTPGYVAPEEVLEGPAAVTPAVDVYGLAAVGYALLTGAAPAFGEDVLAMLSRSARPVIPPTVMGTDVPPALEAALLQALDPDPRARPDAAGLRAALQLAEAQLGMGDLA